MSETIVAVDRALDVLLLLYTNGEEMGVSEISRELGLQKSTVHRTLSTFEAKGFVYKNKENDRYWLGTKIYAMGLLAGERFSLADLVRPFAKKLFDEFQEVVNVSILDENVEVGYKSIIIQKEADPVKVLSVNPNIGSSTDAHVSAVGKCMLAYSKNLQTGKLRKLKKYTDKSIIDPDSLMAELQKIRETGYAIDNEEQELGLYCIGAPILDRTGVAIAAISMSGPTVRMKGKDLEAKIQKVMEIAQEISSLTKQLK